MRRILAVVAIIGAALAGSAGPAAAATGNQTFIIFGQDDPSALLVAFGPVSGTGTDFESEVSEESVFVFPNGSFHVDHPSDSDVFHFNPVTCVGTDRFTGTYTLSGGTGAYAGISGSGTYRGHAIVVGKRLANGTCSEEDPAVFSSFFVRATGTTTLP